MEFSSDLNKRAEQIDQIASDFFKIDFNNSELHFVMLMALIEILLEKNVITEAEFETTSTRALEHFKLLKRRNQMKKALTQENDGV